MNRSHFFCTAVLTSLAMGAAMADEAAKPQQTPAQAVEAPAADVQARAQAEAQAEAQAQFRRTLRQMRTLFEQEDAQADAIARGNTQGIQLASSDMPSIGAMRDQLSRQFERLEDRCFGMDAKVNGGNLIVICGNNAGTAENANIGSGNSSTTIVVPPPPPPAEAQSQPAEEKAP
jgi:hypothetical protein